MKPLSASRAWLRKEVCNEQCWSDNLRVFRGLPQDPEGSQARLHSKLSGHDEALPHACRGHAPTTDYAVDPWRPVLGTSPGLPAHDRDHTQEPCEHSKSAACSPAYLLPLSRCSSSGHAG